jgi:hypothetical protein
VRPFLCCEEIAVVKHLVVFGVALLLAACGGGPDNSSGGVTQAEAEALDNAAQTLDAQAKAPRLAE